MIKKTTSMSTVVPIILLVLTFVISMVITIRSKDNLDVRSRASGNINPYDTVSESERCSSGNLLDIPDGCADYVIKRRGDCRDSVIGGFGIEGCGEYYKYIKEKAPITVKERVCYRYPTFPGCD